jgi:hypothetical protein
LQPAAGKNHVGKELHFRQFRVWGACWFGHVRKCIQIQSQFYVVFYASVSFVSVSEM